MPRLIASRTRLPCFNDVEKDRGATEDPDTARGGMLGIAGGVPTWAGEGSVGWGDGVEPEGAADWRGGFEPSAADPGTCLGDAMLRDREDVVVEERSDGEQCNMTTVEGVKKKEWKVERMKAAHYTPTSPSSSATSGRPRSEATRCKNRTVASFQWHLWHLWRRLRLRSQLGSIVDSFTALRRRARGGARMNDPSTNVIK